MIEIKRIYLRTGEERKILLNTSYIMKVAETEEGDKPQTRIVFDSGKTSEGPDVMYTSESYAAVKAKITRSKKK